MWVLQSPDEVLDWHTDWTDFLESGDEISESEWEISPEPTDTAAPVLDNESIDTSGSFTTVYVSNLRLGYSYQLKNTIITSGGRTAVREITIRCSIQP
jgi:hypothetical protein